MAQILGANVGVSQINVPTPVRYRIFSNIFIIVILPATTALLHGWGIKDQVLLNHIDQLSIFAGAIVKGIGIISGNGQVYSPSNSIALKEPPAVHDIDKQ